MEEGWAQLVSTTDVESEPVILTKDKFIIGRLKTGTSSNCKLVKTETCTYRTAILIPGLAPTPLLPLASLGTTTTVYSDYCCYCYCYCYYYYYYYYYYY